MERGSIGPTTMEYLVKWRDERIVAILPVQHFTALDLLNVLGRDVRRWLGKFRRLAPNALRINVIFAGHILGEGTLLLAPGENLSETAGQFLFALRAMGHRRRAGWLVWKDLPDTVLDVMRGAARRSGFFAVPALPDTVLDLSEPSFGEFVAALPAKPRRNTRAKLRRLSASGTTLHTITDADEIADELVVLYRNVLQRAESQLDVLTLHLVRRSVLGRRVKPGLAVDALDSRAGRRCRAGWGMGAVGDA